LLIPSHQLLWDIWDMMNLDRKLKHRIATLRTLATIALACAALYGCSRTLNEPVAGQYRATLALPGGEAPFGLEVAKDDGKLVLVLANGAERTRVTDVRMEEGTLIARFPGYENSLRAKVAKDRLEGAVTLIKAGGQEQVIPFEARRGETHRFFADSLSDNADVQGRWSMTLTNEQGEITPAVAIFEQEHDRVAGTVLTPTGDHRYLEGQVRGNDVFLSTFSGGLAYLYRLQVTPSGDLVGDYWQGLAWHETVEAKPNSEATLDGSRVETSLQPEQRLEFTFADLDGTPVSLSDERFRGKVVLVTIGGSWCPNCHDEARFLGPFYRKYREQGFEVVALMFERHGEFAKAVAAVRDYRKDLDIDYPTLVAGVSDNDDASKKLPSLSGVFGYPTAIMIDKQGVVRDIHTGFSGPATGAAYEEYVAEFTQLVETLLAE
jgi:thiol-disulfide isomerase/thioredoxin